MSHHERASQSDPVVGIAEAISRHEGENLRRQSDVRRVMHKVNADDELQDIIFAPSLEQCEVHQKVGEKFVQCDLPAETICRVKHLTNRYRVCDVCFTEKFWWLVVLLSVIPGANALEFKIAIDFCEIVGILSLFAFVVLTVAITLVVVLNRWLSSLERIVPMFCNSVIRVSDSITATWRHTSNVKAATTVVSSLTNLWGGRPTPILQGFSNEVSKWYKTVCCVVAGFLMLCSMFFVKDKNLMKKLSEEYKTWKERAAASKYVASFLKFVEDALSGIWAPFSDPKEDAVDLRENLSRTAKDRNLQKYSKVKILVDTFPSVLETLSLRDQLDYIARIREVHSAEEAINLLRNYKLSDQTFLQLAKHYEASNEEVFEVWPDKAGIGLAGPENEMKWLFSSNLMKAAFRMNIILDEPNLGLDNAQAAVQLRAKQHMLFQSALQDWNDHCRSCDKFPHKECHTLEWEGSSEAKANLNQLQLSLGALAWPSMIINGRTVTVKEFHVKDNNSFTELKVEHVAEVKPLAVEEEVPVFVEGPSDEAEQLKGELWEKFISSFPKEKQEEMRDPAFFNLYELKVTRVEAEVTTVLKTYEVYSLSKVVEFKKQWLLYQEKFPAKVVEEEAEVDIKHTTYKQKLSDLLTETRNKVNEVTEKGRRANNAFFSNLGYYLRRLYLLFGDRPSVSSEDGKFSLKLKVLSFDAREEWEECDDEVAPEDDQQMVYCKSSTDAKIATLTDIALGKAFSIFAGTILVVSILASAFVNFRAEQATGWRMQAKGDNKRRNKERYDVDEDWALTEKELRDQQDHAYNEHVNKWEAYDSDYHFKQGVQLQGAVHPHTLEKILVPVDGPLVQGVSCCENLEDVLSRVFSVYASETSKEHLINAFLVGKVLFCQKHSVNSDVWLENRFGEKFFVRKEQWKDYGKADLIYLIWNSIVRKGNKVSLAEPKVGTPVQMVSARLRGSAKSGVVVMKGKTYSWATYESALGDCGAPVVNNQGLIVGFHQLGSTYANGFISVDEQMIQFVRNNGESSLTTTLEIQGFSYAQDGREFKPCIKNKKFCNHFFQFAAPRGLPKTIGDFWIADFNKGDLEAGLRRFDVPDVIIESESLEWATRQLYNELQVHVGRTRKMTVDEIHPEINQDSGPGYPFILKYQKKRDMLLEDPLYYKSFSERPREVWWWAKLKCEIREIGKMARTYVASNVHFTYYANQYFLDFNQKFVEAGAKQNGFFSTVGMAVQYAGWNKLYDRLAKHPFVLEGDGKRYDTRVLAELLWRVCFVRSLLFEPTSSQDLKDIVWCYHQFIYSKIKTPEGFEAFKVKGQPSGGNNTIVDNTCVLFLMYMIAWYNLVGPEHDWKKHLEFALNGDDSLVTVSTTFKEQFNPVSVSREFKFMGMDYEVPNNDWRKWEEASYLSRRFDTKLSGIVVPRFEFAKMYSSLHFSKKPNDFAYSLLRCNGILAEMFTDRQARKVLREYQQWLIEKVRANPGSEFYEAALTGVQTDYCLHMLYVTVPLQVQGKPGIEESVTPGKREINMQNNNKNQIVKEKTVKIIQKPRIRRRKQKRVLVKSVPRQTPRIKKKNNNLNKQDKRAAELAYAIANPLDSPNVRIATSYGSVPTGVATLQERIATFPPADGYTQTTVANCYVFRSALRSCLFGMPWPGTVVTYEANDPSFDLPQTEFNHFGQPLNAATTTTRHGPVLWPGKYGHDAKEYGYLMNNEDIVTITVGSWPSGLVAFNVQVYVYTAKGFVPTYKGTLANGGPPFTYTYTSVPNNIPTYVAFGMGFTTGVGASASVPINFQLTTGNPSSHSSSSLYFCQHALPQINEQIPSVEDVRVIGASLMWTNTSPNITKQGQAAMAQLSATADFEDYLTYDSLSSINPLISCVKKAEDGIYGFLKPTHVNDFKFLGEWESATGGVTDPLDSYLDGVEEAYFQIDSQYDSLGCALSLPGNLGITQSGYWTVAYKIEYRSDDQWRSLAIGNKNDQVLEAALASISQMPQFHSNAFHVSDITNWLSEKLKFGKELLETHGPTMIKSLETVIGGLSLLATVL